MLRNLIQFIILIVLAGPFVGSIIFGVVVIIQELAATQQRS